MKLFSNGDDQDDEGLDIGEADSEELEAIAYRFVQIIPDSCVELARKLAYEGMNHPVIFLLDVGDPFGLAIARKVSDTVIIQQALKETGSDARPGVIAGVDVDTLESKEPIIFYAIKERMTGLLGYFPIVVVAKAGFSIFPWPFTLKEKSKFKLFSST